MLDKRVLDKVKGVFFGQAIGDALGLGTEFLTKEEGKRYYPAGLSAYNQIVQDKHRSRWSRGDWTDDTDQFFCIVDSIISNKTIHLEDIASRFYAWYSNYPLGIGTTTLQVLKTPGYVKHPEKAAQLAWKLKKGKAAANGALMRNSILGVFRYKNIEEVLINSESVAGLTHFDQRCKDSCKIASYLIAKEMSNQPVTQDQLVNFISNLSSAEQILEYIQFPLDYPISALNLEDSNAIGYTLKALAAGLWCYFNSKSFADGILEVVNECGDADTNGCIAASLLGAKYGYVSLYSQRPDLIEDLKGKNRLNQAFTDFSALLEMN